MVSYFGPLSVNAPVAAALLPDGPPAPVACEIRWQGEGELDLPGWAARLRFQPLSEDGSASVRERPRVIRALPTAGEWRVRLRDQGPSRPMKKCWQERGVPPALRAWLPLIEVDGVRVLVAGLGELAHCERSEHVLANSLPVAFEPMLPRDPRRRFCESHRI